MTGAPVRALPFASAGGGGAAAAAAAAAAAIANVQQAQQATQQSMSSLLRASQAVAAMQQAQAAARALALKTYSSVPNGLLPGGLVPGSGLNAAGVAAPVTSWIGLNTPVQTSADGQTLVTVQQTQQKAIANWSSFNVGQNTTLYFNQSAGNSSTGNGWVVLNRVIDPSGVPSQILGEIRAEGSVYVIDANGIVFGGASQVNVNSLIASSLNLFSNELATSNSRFLNGGIGDLNPTNVTTDSILLTSSAPGAGNVTIAPGAQINLGTQGLGVIAAPNVTNGGSITAPSGQVALVAGIGVSYDYNYSSFVPVGPDGSAGQAQGYNDNSTTNLRFANYGKLTNAQGDDITPVGTLVNNGLIQTTQGNITLLGGAVQQNGVAIATTSVKQPGSIVVESLYEVGVNGARNPADEEDETFYTGSLAFGPQAVTSILPDSGGGTLASDATSLAPFEAQQTGLSVFTTPLPTQGFGIVEIIGQAIDFQGGTEVYAPGQSISANSIVLPDPRAQVPGSGRVLLESGAVLDVSGLADVELPVSSRLLTVTLGGNELSDDPEQRNGPLYGQKITVDMSLSGVNAETGESWIGTPLANLSSYENLVLQSIGQLLVKGGAVDLSGPEIVSAPGSIVNLTGGYIHYIGGIIDTTRLIGADGGLYDIGDASPDITYAGIAGSFTQNHPHWGINETYVTPLLDGGYYQPDYIQGGNAGALTVDVYGAGVADAGAFVFQSTLLAQSVAGLQQISNGTLPHNGSFSFTGLQPIEIGDPSLLSGASLAASSLPADFSMASSLLAVAGSPYAVANVLSSQMLDNGGFGDISLTTSDPTGLTEDTRASLAVQSGGSINLTAGNVTINGSLIARAGTLSITTEPVLNSLDDKIPGDIVIGPSAVLNVAGLFYKETPGSAVQQGDAALINGGSISLVADDGVATDPNTQAFVADLTGNITLSSGSLLDLEGGGIVQPNGLLQTAASGAPAGAGGNLTLATYQDIAAPVSTTSKPTRGRLTLDGTIDALGFSGGGTLTLQAVALQIGGNAGSTPAYGFYFDPAFWGDLGFGSFKLSSVLQSEVPAGAILTLTHENLLPDLATINGAPNGADPGAYSTTGYLTGTQLSPTDLSVTAALEQSSNGNNTSGGGDYVQIDNGAEILGAPGSSISLASYSIVSVLGELSAPGGTISLTLDYPPYFNGGGPLGPLYLGPNSVLDVAGTTVVNPLAAQIETRGNVITPYSGEVLPGGTVNLTDLYSPILVSPGSVINVSGASGAFDVTQLRPGLLGGTTEAVSRQPVWSNAGTVNISASTGLLFEGTLIGNPGAPQATGGTLQITSTTNASGAAGNIYLVQDTAAAITASGGSFDFSTYVPTVGEWGSSGTVTVSSSLDAMIFGVDSLNGSGFSSFGVTSADVLGFAGKVSLKLSDSFITSALYYTAANAGNFTSMLPGGIHPTTDGASLSVTAPYIEMGGAPIGGNGLPQFGSPPLTADATLTLNATNQLDLSGFMELQDIGQANFISSGDIRLLPAQYAPQAGTQLLGYLATTGNLTFAAADIYPATDTAFVIEATQQSSTSPPTKVTFEYPTGVAPSNATPLSAAGSILVDASTIVQNGELQAPFGSIILGLNVTNSTISDAIAIALGGNGSTGNYYTLATNTQSVTLGSGSITSVSANGMTIPFGSTVDQTTWVYNPQLNNPTWDGGTSLIAYTYPLTAAPQGVVTLTGNSVDYSSGSVVNLDGGGNLQAQEWVPGTGGSRNVLLQYQTNYQNSTAGQQVPTYPGAQQIFAIVPGYTGKIAPYDANLSQSGLTAGEAIYLAGGNGLPAGVYTLLPAQYATLPGAYRVVSTGVTNPLSDATLALPDGTMTMTGHLTNSITGAVPSATQQFYVQSAAVWDQYSQYALTSAATFFPSYAATNNLATPHVPADAGRLAIAAVSGLTIDGTLEGAAAPGGYGAQVDISSQYIDIIGAGAAVQPGYLALSANALDALGAGSLLIGGTRSETAAGMVITPSANGIIVATDANDPLEAPEIMLVATPQLQATSVQLDAEGDKVSVQTAVAGTGQVVLESDSVVEAMGTAGPGEAGTIILGGLPADLPALPTATETSAMQDGVESAALQNYYLDVDAATGSLVRVSTGSPVTVQLPSAAVLNPGTISVTDDVTATNPVYKVVLPSLAGTTGVVLQPGVELIGGNGLNLASTGTTQIQSGAILSGTNVSVESSQIAFQGSGGGAAAGAGSVIGPATLIAFENAQNIDLQSTGTIDFAGDVSLDITRADGRASLTLGGGALSSDGGQVSIDAATVVLDNELNAPSLAFAVGSGSLAIDADELVFGVGTKTLTGFGSVSLVASRGIVGEGSGSMNFGFLPVTLQTPVVVADASSDQTITTTGALSVVPLAGATPMILGALGGAITLQGGSVTVSSPVQALAGNISLQSSAGNVTVTGTGQLLAQGSAVPFMDVVEYADAGNIVLSANQGTVNIEPGALVDFAGASTGGKGGGLSITTANSVAPVVLDGTLLGATVAGYTGSAFSLDTSGSVSLDGMAGILTAAGVRGEIAIETAVGDLSLSQTLTAQTVQLIADHGEVSVAGTINASGAAGGIIDLFGTSGVALSGSLLATANNPGQLGGTVEIGTSATFNPATGTYNATYGYENVAAANSGSIVIGPSAVINVSGGTFDGLSGGTILIRAPLIEDGSVNVALPANANFQGARSVTLEAYATWSTADNTTGAQHFDGVIDPAGWYDNTGTLLPGAFYNASGYPLASWSGTSLTYYDGTTNSLSYYLDNDYFVPTVPNTAHETFYGYLNGDNDAAVAGTLMGFIETPGFQPVTNSDIANFQETPGVELDNPISAGVNGGDIQVLTNWNLGATKSDGTLVYRDASNGAAPFITLRAGGNIAIEASISDGFQQKGAMLVAPVSGAPYVPPPPPSINYISDTTALSYYNSDIVVWNLGSIDTGGLVLDTSAVALDAPVNYMAVGLASASVTDGYYGLYESYLAAYSTFYNDGLNYNSGYFGPTGPTAPANVTAALATAQADYNPTSIISYSAYLNAYNAYIGAYDSWSGALYVIGTLPVAPLPPPVQSLPPVPPPPPPPPQLARTATSPNIPDAISTPTNEAAIAGMDLVDETSSSYRLVAGANLSSADPLAVNPNGMGDINVGGHTSVTLLANNNSLQIVVPTIVRTGTGSIDIAASGNFNLTDTLAPGVVYTAGTPVQSAADDDGTTIAFGGDVYKSMYDNTDGISSILTSVVNAEGAGNISLTVGGNIVGIENVIDTLSTTAGTPSGLTGDPGAFVGQLWEPWLLTSPNAPNVPWYVNFGSFEQGIMSIGGNVTVTAGGSISDLAVSLPTTAYLDSSNALHVTGGGNLSVTAGGSIYSGDFYVGQGIGAITAGGVIAPDFNYVSPDDPTHSYPVATLLAVQYGTISVDAREAINVGGVYDPTYLWAPGKLAGTGDSPIASYTSAFSTPVNLVPYVTSMSATSGASIQSTSGDVTFNSLLAQGDIINMGSTTIGTSADGDNAPAAYVSSLLLPASLNLVSLQGNITIDHGGGLYPSSTGTLSIIADQSVDLSIPFLTGTIYGQVTSMEPFFTDVGNVFGTTLEKLDYPVGTGILPTASDPALLNVWDLPPTLTNDPSLIQHNQTNPVHVYALNGSIADGVKVTAGDGQIYALDSLSDDSVGIPVRVAVGGTVDQISLIPNAPAEIYAGENITDLPFFGTNFTASDITSIIAGGNIGYNIDGADQSPTIELAGPGALDVIAGGNLSFESQRLLGVTETGIRTIGNSIDETALPILHSAAPTTVNAYPYSTTTDLGYFGNPYLPNGGASVNVLFGVGPGINTAGFIAAYVNPMTAGTTSYLDDLTGFITQYDTELGVPPSGSLTPAQAWAVFAKLPADQQQLLVEQVFFDVLNTTGLNYHDPSSSTYQQYSAGYQAINTLFPASYGYTANSLGAVNGANQSVDTGTLDLRGSTIQTQQGGDVSILGPRGRILVGSAIASPAVDLASEGILTLENGNIDIFVDQSVLVAQSRIMTEQGGDILMWSSNGDLDAGEGAKTSVSQPRPLYACDIDFRCSADIKGAVSGAGIATLQSLVGVPVGNANLIAPRGTVNAGAAGIRVSGNLNVVALQVLNSFNIQVQGVTTGIPGTTAPNIGALSDASAASGAATKAITAGNQGSGNAVQPSILIVEIEGYGGDDDDNEPQQSQPSRHKKTNERRASYDPNGNVRILGYSNLSDTDMVGLTDKEKQAIRN